MKKLFYSIIFILATGPVIFGQPIPTRDSLSMGSGYLNDIFYSMENGEVSAVPRNTWDIAFYTARFSAGILVNEGFGDILYTYPKGDTSDWANIDTAGLSTWAPMYNSNKVWEDGAFNAHALGHPDYGWGIYNPVNHNLYGDSLFIIHIPDVGYQKLWIEEKRSVENIYVFRFADLNGANEHAVELDVNPYTMKRFIYYSLSKNEAVDREPSSDSWDLMFTKYMDSVPDNEGGFQPYLVTGTTNNVGIKANNFYPVNKDFYNWASKPMDSAKNTIGYNWKQIDMETYTWTVTDSNYYFIRNYKNDIYRLKFIEWDGSQTGNFVLDKWLVSLSSVNEQHTLSLPMEVYPNPSSGHFTIRSSEDLQGDVILSIMDQSGRQVWQKQYSGNELRNGINPGNLNLAGGIYFLRIKGDNYAGTAKLLIR
ncbi:MAG TPA: T9SS type A sorting domain-containing protein [Bacteroidetes bacterium]|nr:T9SS type A sorting domain-containing protein [Bacteroidota bacterium]